MARRAWLCLFSLSGLAFFDFAQPERPKKVDNTATWSSKRSKIKRNQRKTKGNPSKSAEKELQAPVLQGQLRAAEALEGAEKLGEGGDEVDPVAN